MIYPASFEEKIGFDVIRTLTKEHCSSAMAKSLVDSICYSIDYDEVVRKIQETDEFFSVLLYDDAFPIQEYDDLRATLTHLHVEGTFVEVEELARLRDFIASVIHTFVYFRIRHEEENKYPALWEICQNVLLEKELQESNSVDFDDLLLWTHKLLTDNPQIRDNYSRRFHHILVDEFQDTNTVQYQLLKLLVGADGNFFAVGDEDQSIYRWRGADYRNILQFL